MGNQALHIPLGCETSAHYQITEALFGTQPGRYPGCSPSVAGGGRQGDIQASGHRTRTYFDGA